MYKIGFIDEDAGQRNQFRQTFKDDFDVCLIDLKQAITEEEIIREVFDNHLDALIVDYRMDEFLGYNGDLIVRNLTEKNPHFPVIILTSYEEDALDFVDDANIINGKEIWDGESEAELNFFKKKLNRIITNYYEKITDAEEKLKELEAIKNDGGLQPNEEDEYIKVNNFLGKVFGGGEYLSGTFYSVDTNKKLDSLIEKTEQLLNKLSKNNESV